MKFGQDDFPYEVRVAPEHYDPQYGYEIVTQEVYDWVKEELQCKRSLDYVVFWRGLFVFKCPIKAAMFKLKWA